MAKFVTELTTAHRDFIARQKIYFVASAPHTGRVNLSPQGMDTFRVLSTTRVGYLDVTSSGNETSAHTLENGRITFMFCSFENNPNILRLYGKGFTILPGTKEWPEYAAQFEIYPSTRQIITADIDLVQTSCGFGVPLYFYQGERDIHFEWAEKKGEKGLKEYKELNNIKSLDGLPTPLGLK